MYSDFLFKTIIMNFNIMYEIFNLYKLLKNISKNFPKIFVLIFLNLNRYR